ncbi:hypothetical protein B0H14DRAFT_2938790, partial [Mycena olivaceomarginata]
MWLCLAMTIFSTCLFSPLFFAGREISLIHASVAHISLYHSFPFVYPNISLLFSYLIYTLPTRTLHARTQCVLLHP